MVRICKGAYTSNEYTNSVLLSRAERIVLLHKSYGGGLLEIATIKNLDLIMLALENELPVQLLYGFHKKFMDYPFIKKVYLPFGTHWMPYIMRRLKERIGGK